MTKTEKLGWVWFALLLIICVSGMRTWAQTEPSTPLRQNKLNLDWSDVQEEKGCLSVGKIFAHLAQLPPGSLVREVTRDAVIRKTNGLPRPQFKRNFTLRSFVFREVDAATYAFSSARVEQIACEKVVFKTPIGVDAEYRIDSAEKDKLSFELDQKRWTFRLVGSREIEISKEAWVLDDCNDEEKTFPVEVRSTLRWGPPEALQQTPERIQYSFLQKLSEGLDQISLDLGRRIARPYLDGSVSLLGSDLSAIARGIPNIQTQRCSALPDPTPTPKPTPAPVEPPFRKRAGDLEQILDSLLGRPAPRASRHGSEGPHGR